MVSAVLFDAGGVVLPPNPRFFIAQMARFGRGLGHDEASAIVPALIGRAATATTDPTEFWAGSGVHLGLADQLRISYEQAVALWAAAGRRGGRHDLWAGLDPEIIDVIRLCRRAGCGVGVVSNSDGTLCGILERLGVRDLFDVVVDSHAAGVSKPSPKIFELAAGALGTSVGECVFVGDDPYFDIVGSQRAGVRESILWDRHGRMRDVMKTLISVRRSRPGVRHASDGGELLAHLTSIWET